MPGEKGNRNRRKSDCSSTHSIGEEDKEKGSSYTNTNTFLAIRICSMFVMDGIATNLFPYPSMAPSQTERKRP